MRKLAIIVLVLTMAGCCSCKERYAPFLGQLRDNLQNDIRPKYERALTASGRDADLIANDLGLVDDSVASITRVLDSGIAPVESSDE